ncbi:DASH family cryptochrome [Kaistella antarctica]|uniref:Cryptochrome DASH n=1 Tax=Kaistella antarctica TaxID=266748 RepID=A0A448NN88_9FLAO|nr:DASH family cryptochrome [Kaistella antarctica]KEY19834.1 DASH family cryptochrome [Kaistella antarctica]SEV97079.1 deoxyribodipyrimidine photo-lyase (single-stranded DNA-specific) [Kaistella antarctica]VEH96361.1 Cryptochrome DASH [Kaistella antarctica]
MKRGLVWFKNDLRLQDNEALFVATKDCDELVFCYSIEQSLFENIDLGFRKADINRFKFLEQSITDLQHNLENLGGHLVIGSESSLQLLPKLIEDFEITEIYAEEEYASEELSLINQLKNLLPAINYHLFWGKTLYHKRDIPFDIANIPLTSKAYRIPAGQEAEPRRTFPVPQNLKSCKHAKSTKFPSYSNYGFTKKEYNEASPFLEGGETLALERLQYYTFKSELLTGYRWSRNKSEGLDYSSKFSPYLALGCISPRTIFEVVKEYEQLIKKNQSTWWLIFELVWRDYFTFKGMRFGDEIFKTKGYKDKEVDFENDPAKFKRWCNGTTGIPFIDAHMRQLNETGYMSNRGRVNCASYFVYDLKIDWTWGAAYFESKLIDYDVSSNWMNWHMQAFEIYYTNPVHQSNKYNSQDYIRKWIPELQNKNNIEVLIPWEFDITEYPKPVEIYQKWTRAINLIQKLEKD